MGLVALGIFLLFAVIGSLNRPDGATPDAGGPAAEADFAILSPETGTVVRRDTVEVSGSAPAGAEVIWVRPMFPDDRVNADGGGRWSIHVDLNEGENELTFRLRDTNTTRNLLVTYLPDEQAPSPSRTPRPVPTPAPVPTSEPPPFADIALSGFGDTVPTFTKPANVAAIAFITHNGGSNFAVWTLSADGSYNDLLVNVIGGYAGTVLFDEYLGVQSVALEITADGVWSITIRPLTYARVWDGTSPLNGSGDDVVRISPAVVGFKTVTVQHTGSSNFAVWAYSSSNADLLVNEIGPYLGQHLLGSGTLLLEVTADGAWTFAPS